MEQKTLTWSGRIRQVPFDDVMCFLLDLRLGQSFYANDSAPQILMSLHGNIWQAKHLCGGNDERSRVRSSVAVIAAGRQTEWQWRGYR